MERRSIQLADDSTGNNNYTDVKKAASAEHKHGVNSHFYADDSQLYVSARHQEASDAKQRLVDCIDIAQWMASNRLKLNPAKTDFMWCATHRRKHQLSKDRVTFAGSDIQPSSTVRDLGIVLDSELSFGPHISQLVSRCFLQLRRIKSCVRALPMDAAKAVVNSFVISRVDYCNSLLAGAPRYQLDRLQSVLNTAALITRRCQEARPHQTCAAGLPPLAAGPAAHPVQVVPADVQSATSN